MYAEDFLENLVKKVLRAFSIHKRLDREIFAENMELQSGPILNYENHLLEQNFENLITKLTTQWKQQSTLVENFIDCQELHDSDKVRERYEKILLLFAKQGNTKMDKYLTIFEKETSKNQEKLLEIEKIRLNTRDRFYRVLFIGIRNL